jgi:hypothetical protein
LFAHRQWHVEACGQPRIDPTTVTRTGQLCETATPDDPQRVPSTLNDYQAARALAGFEQHVLTRQQAQVLVRVNSDRRIEHPSDRFGWAGARRCVSRQRHVGGASCTLRLLVDLCREGDRGGSASGPTEGHRTRQRPGGDTRSSGRACAPADRDRLTGHVQPAQRAAAGVIRCARVCAIANEAIVETMANDVPTRIRTGRRGRMGLLLARRCRPQILICAYDADTISAVGDSRSQLVTLVRAADRQAQSVGSAAASSS